MLATGVWGLALPFLKKNIQKMVQLEAELRWQEYYAKTIHVWYFFREQTNYYFAVDSILRMIILYNMNASSKEIL